MKAVSIIPENLSALHHLGTIREKMGGEKLEQALKDFNTVIEIDDRYSPAYNGRGLVWDRFFKFDDALEDFSIAIGLDTENPVYWHSRGCCYRNLGDLDKALDDFGQAAYLDPLNPIIYSN